MSFRFPFARRDDGRFRGQTLDEIAKFPGIEHHGKKLQPGIVWLRGIADWAEGKGTHGEMVAAVRAFLAQPWAVLAMEQAEDTEKEERARRAIQRNRTQYRDRRRREDYEDRNLERGY